MKILLTHAISQKCEESIRQAGHEVITLDKKTYTEGDLIKALKKYDPSALICFLSDPITRQVLQAGANLKIVSNYAVGYNNIDVDAAKELKIAVANTPINGYPVAEFTASLAVSLLRRITEGHQFAAKGKYKGWDPHIFVGESLKGKTLGIVGSGRIGSEAARILAQGFGVTVVYSDIMKNENMERDLGAKKLELDELFRASDIISLHVALNESTKHLVNAERLSQMKKSAVIVNTSRGPVIDEKALASALKDKKIAGAALDVYEFEPKITPSLLKMPNVIVTPHIASATNEARLEMASMSASNVIDYLAGKRPIGAVSIP